MAIDKLYVANAGGAFPGGMFGIGVLERLAEELPIAEVTGESSGAINALLVANGQTLTGAELWRDVLRNAPPTFLAIQKHVFAAIEEYATLEQFVGSRVHARIVYNQINNFWVTDDEAAGFPDHVIHLLSCIPCIIKGTRGILDNRAYGLTGAEFKKKIQASCSLPPFYLKATKFKGEGIINDGCLVDELGGVGLLIRDAAAEENVAVLVITRYPEGSKKQVRRSAKVRELCEKHQLPAERAIIVCPETKLPVTSNYERDMELLDGCYVVGKQIAGRVLERL